MNFNLRVVFGDNIDSILKGQNSMPSMFAYFFVTFIVCCTIFSSVVASNSTVNTDALGPYKISTVTVSGVSSGAYMAVQMHMAYSMIISGNAAFAGVSFNIHLYIYFIIFLIIF